MLNVFCTVMYTIIYAFSAAVVIDGKLDAGMQKMSNYVDCSYNMCCSKGVNGTVTAVADPLPCKDGNSTGKNTDKICSGVSWRGGESERRTWWTWWTWWTWCAGVGVCGCVCGGGVRSPVTHTRIHTHVSPTHTHIYTHQLPPFDPL